jgi:hypothetical protein
LYPSYLLFNPSYLSSKFSFHTFLSNLWRWGGCQVLVCRDLQ